jgi:hypothetical protein
MAKRAHAKTVEVNSSHVASMSYPKETAKLTEEAAGHTSTSSSSPRCGASCPPSGAVRKSAPCWMRR